jgi:hypothetical protein
VAFGAHTYGSFVLGTDGYNLLAGFSADVTFSATSGGLQISGTGSASGGMTFAGQSWNVGAGFDLNNSGITFHCPWAFGDISANW